MMEEADPSVSKQATVPVDEAVFLIAPPTELTPEPLIVQVEIVAANVLPFKSKAPPEFIVNEVFSFPQVALNCMECPFCMIKEPCHAGAEVPEPSVAVFQFESVLASVPALILE